MKTYDIYGNISLNSCQNEKRLRYNLQRKSRHTFGVQVRFFRKSCHLCDNAERCGRTRQVTDGDKKHALCMLHI
jgi:hypothetical protein